MHFADQLHCRRRPSQATPLAAARRSVKWVQRFFFPSGRRTGGFDRHRVLKLLRGSWAQGKGSWSSAVA